jgi:hypothetical protein
MWIYRQLSADEFEVGFLTGRFIENRPQIERVKLFKLEKQAAAFVHFLNGGTTPTFAKVFCSGPMPLDLPGGI